MGWHVDEVLRCRHTGDVDCGVEEGRCRAAFLRHVYYQDDSLWVTAIVEVGPVQDSATRREDLAIRVARALDAAGVVP